MVIPEPCGACRLEGLDVEEGIGEALFLAREIEPAQPVADELRGLKRHREARGRRM